MGEAAAEINPQISTGLISAAAAVPVSLAGTLVQPQPSSVLCCVQGSMVWMMILYHSGAATHPSF